MSPTRTARPMEALAWLQLLVGSLVLLGWWTW